MRNPRPRKRKSCSCEIRAWFLKGGVLFGEDGSHLYHKIDRLVFVHVFKRQRRAFMAMVL